MAGRDTSEWLALRYLLGVGGMLILSGGVFACFTWLSGLVLVGVGAALSGWAYSSYTTSRGAVKAPRPYLPPSGRV